MFQIQRGNEMKLLLQKQMFSWFDCYDIYDENGAPVYQVRGQVAWGHQFRVYDVSGREVGGIRQVTFSFLPRYEIYLYGTMAGYVSRKFSLLLPKYEIAFKGWTVKGNPMEWNYSVMGNDGQPVAHVSKKIFNLKDTYVMETDNYDNLLPVLMLVLAIDAEKASRLVS